MGIEGASPFYPGKWIMASSLCLPASPTPRSNVVANPASVTGSFIPSFPNLNVATKDMEMGGEDQIWKSPIACVGPIISDIVIG